MSQHDLDIANQTFPNTRSDLNDALQALGSTSSGATVPSTTYANQLWYDTANNKLYIRNEDNDANIEICELDQTNDSVEFFKADSIRTALVEYTDGTDAFTISSDGTVAFDTNTLYVDATNNRVGIGTSSPAVPLHISNSNPTIRYQDSDGTNQYGEVQMAGGNFIIQSRNDTADGNIVFRGLGGGSATERMRIDSSGNVGIGTSSPARNLHISDSGTPTIRMQDAGGTNQYAELLISGSSTILQARNDTSDGNIIFRGLGGGSTTERMRIDSSGNVGIGTSSPSTPLDVAGKGTFSGTSSFEALELITSDTNRVYMTGNSSVSGDMWRIGTNNSNPHLNLSALQATGDIIFRSGGNNIRMTVDSSGKIFINTSTNYNNEMLQIDGGTSTALRLDGDGTSLFSLVNFSNANGIVGTIKTTGSSTQYNTSSDYRLKENLDYTFDATTRLKQLKPCRFNFKSDADTTVDGFIAHEVTDIVPEAISGEKDAMMTEEYEVTPAVLDDDGNIVEEAVMGTREVPDYQGIDQSKLVPLLVKTCQEQQTIIEDLQTRITALENN